MTEKYDDRVCHSEHPIRFIKQRVSDVAPEVFDSVEDKTEKKNVKIHLKPTFWTSVLAGGIAGVVVDISLYPLDTIKTRLQSPEGFRAAGGFRGIYKGILPVVLTSAPVSALFFASYNALVNTFRPQKVELNPIVYIAAASGAEILCSAIRVPVEVIKQRSQTSNRKNYYIFKKTLNEEGFFGLYRGFLNTLLREIPFAAIQYPLWEYMINQFIIYENGKELTPLQTAYCGAAAGAIAAGLTTPMDVIKTRIMLAEKQKLDSYGKKVNFNIAKEIYLERGLVGFFAGFTPRILWIMLGGFMYFGSYEVCKIYCEKYLNLTQNEKNLDQQSKYPEKPKFDFAAEEQCKTNQAFCKPEETSVPLEPNTSDSPALNKIAPESVPSKASEGTHSNAHEDVPVKAPEVVPVTAPDNDS